MGFKAFLLKILACSFLLTVNSGCEDITPKIDAAAVEVSSISVNNGIVTVTGQNIGWFQSAQLESNAVPADLIDVAIISKSAGQLILASQSLAQGPLAINLALQYRLKLDAGLKEPFVSSFFSVVDNNVTPNVAFSSPNLVINSANAFAFNVTGTCNVAGADVDLTLDDGNGHTVNESVTCTGSTFSVNFFGANALDESLSLTASASMLSATASASSFIKDTVLPVGVSAWNHPTGVSNATALAVQISISDANPISYRHAFVSGNSCAGVLSSVPWQNYSGTVTITEDISSLPDGEISLCLDSQDLAGNIQNTANRIAWTKDTLAPALTSLTLSEASSNAGYLRSTANVELDGIASFNEAQVTLNFYDVGSCAGTPSFTESTGQTISRLFDFLSAVDQSDNTVAVQLVDAAGNSSSCHIRNVFVDTQAPVGVVLSLNGGEALTPKGSVDFEVTADDGAGSGIASVTLHTLPTCAGGPIAGGAWPLIYPADILSHGLSSGGSGSYYAKVIDRAGNSACTSTASQLTYALPLLRAYSAPASYFNDWVTADGSTTCSPNSTLTSDTCSWSGDRRKVITDETSCAGLSMSDNFAAGGAFNWTCKLIDLGAGNNRAVFYSSLKSSVGLRNLIEPDGGGSYRWKTGMITLTGASQGANRSLAVAGALWNDLFALLPANDTASFLTITTPGTIFVVPSDMRTYGYIVSASNVSIVGIGGARLLGPTNGSPPFLVQLAAPKPWIESDMDARGPSVGFASSMVQVSTGCSFGRLNRLQGVGVREGIIGGLCHGLQISDVSLRGQQMSTYSGISLSSASAGVGISRTSVEKFGYGISLTSMINSNLNKVTVSDNVHAGIRIDSPSTTFTLADIISANNSSHGFMIVNGGSCKFTAQDLLAVSNDGNGFNFLNGTNPNSTFVNLASFGSFLEGMFLDSWSDAKFHYFTSGVSSAPGIHVTASSLRNALSQVYSGGSSSYVDIFDNSASPNASVYLGTIAHEGQCGGLVSANCTTLAGMNVGNLNVNLNGAGAPLFETPVSYAWDISTFNSNIAGFPIQNGYKAPGSFAVDITSMTTGKCHSGTCSVWDWRLRSTDTVWRGAAADGDGSNAPATIVGGACPAELSGTEVLSANGQTYLKNAVEISIPNRPYFNKFLGDHDGLCESGEVCLAAPNLGYYQGSSSSNPLLNLCNFTPGSVTGVTMYMYPTNGI